MLTQSGSSPSTGDLEQIGLYNTLNRIARGEADVDALVLLGLRQQGLVALDALALTESGTAELMRLTQALGWFYPDA